MNDKTLTTDLLDWIESQRPKSLVELAVEKSKGIIADLTALGGHNGNRALTCAVEINPPTMADRGIDIDQELAAVVAQDTRANIFQTLFADMRMIKPVGILSLGGAYGSVQFNQSIGIIETAIRQSSKEAVIIVNPHWFTTFQMMWGSEKLVRIYSANGEEPSPIFTLHQRAGFVDSYARYDVPISICEPGWFDFSGEEVLIPAKKSMQIGNPNPIQHFETDVYTFIRPRMVKNFEFSNFGSMAGD